MSVKVEAVNPSEIVDIDAITAQIANLTDRADIYSILAPFDAADQVSQQQIIPSSCVALDLS